MRWHVLPLIAVTCVGLVACGRPRSRICPVDLSLAERQSKPGQFLWCQSKDGKRAQYIEFHPGGMEKRQICDYRDGRADGPFSAWFPGSKPWIKGQFVAGRPDGIWDQWNKAGLRVAEGEYRDGRFVAGAPVASTAVCDKLHP